MADRAVIRAKVEGITKVLTIPSVVTRITSLVNAGTVSAAEIAEEIGKDQVLAAKVLKLVNSGFYGFRQPVTTITHATVLLGSDVMRTVVLTAAVADVVDSMNSFMGGLWEHSVATARAATAIAQRRKAPDPEEYGLAGLLHDIGKVVIAQTFPAEHAKIRAQVAEKNCLQIEAEQDVLGVTHAEMGMWLLRKWSLPPHIVYPVAYHSSFHPRRDHADRTAVVHLADIICRAKGIGYAGDNRMPRMDPEALALLQLSLDDVEQVCAQLQQEVLDGLLD
ncbi:MAG: HDOD domain-containing protein [Vicinamibacterales bacterium]